MKKKILAIMIAVFLSLPLYIGARTLLDMSLKNCKHCGDVQSCIDGDPNTQSGYSQCDIPGDGQTPPCMVWGTFGPCISDQPGEG